MISVFCKFSRVAVLVLAVSCFAGVVGAGDENQSSESAPVSTEDAQVSSTGEVPEKLEEKRPDPNSLAGREAFSVDLLCKNTGQRAEPSISLNVEWVDMNPFGALTYAYFVGVRGSLRGPMVEDDIEDVVMRTYASGASKELTFTIGHYLRDKPNPANRKWMFPPRMLGLSMDLHFKFFAHEATATAVSKQSGQMAVRENFSSGTTGLTAFAHLRYVHIGIDVDGYGALKRDGKPDKLTGPISSQFTSGTVARMRIILPIEGRIYLQWTYVLRPKPTRASHELRLAFGVN